MNLYLIYVYFLLVQISFFVCNDLLKWSLLERPVGVFYWILWTSALFLDLGQTCRKATVEALSLTRKQVKEFGSPRESVEKMNV